MPIIFGILRSISRPRIHKVLFVEKKLLSETDFIASDAGIRIQIKKFAN